MPIREHVKNKVDINQCIKIEVTIGSHAHVRTGYTYVHVNIDAIGEFPSKSLSSIV